MGIFDKDLENILARTDSLNSLKNSTILVTGATGLIGSLFVKTLLYFNTVKHINIRILAVIRNLEKAKTIFDEDEHLVFIVQDLQEDFSDITEPIDYIVHTAAITSSKVMIENPVDTIELSVFGTRSMLKLAKDKQVKKMIYVSSMEAYGNVGNLGHKVTEEELGYIDLSNIRSGYPESKRLCEILCNAYAKQYGVNVVSARLAQTFGAGILRGENRVFAQFARSAIHKKDIVLHTKGLSEGNYVYTSDAICALLALLHKGENGETYNVSNENCHTTISGMAEMVSNVYGVKVIYDIPEDVSSLGYAPDVKLYLSSQKLQHLGWTAQVDLEEAYKRMIAYMIEMDM